MGDDNTWIAGKVAVVTGAAVGLGRGFAEALASAGASLALCDVRPEIVQVAGDLAAKYGVDVQGWVADVGVPEDVWRVVDDTVAHFGGIDVLVNNAGTWVATPSDAPLEESIEPFDRLFAVNTRSTFLFGRAVIPLMLDRGFGQIVNIVTDHVYTEPERPTGGGGRMDVYDASKWAINGFTLAWARALEGQIRVNGLCMGATDSFMLRASFGGEPPPDVVAKWKRPEQVAELMIELLEEGPGGRSGWNLPIWVADPIVMPELTDDWAVRVGTMKAIG